MTSQGLYSLATIIKRLEAATSRLEDVADTFDVHNTQGSTGWKALTDGSPDYQGSSTRDDTLPLALAPAPEPTTSILPAATTQTPNDPKSVVAFQQSVVDGKVKPFLELTKSFAISPVIDISTQIYQQFLSLSTLIHLSSSCQKPDQKAIDELLTPLQASIEAITRAKEANRKEREWFNHISVLGEAAPHVGWCVTPKPGPYVDSIKDSVRYYGDKIMQEYKNKDPKHVEWVKSFLAIFDETKKYVIEYHTTGLTWNSKGMSVEVYRSQQPNQSPSTPTPTASVAGSGPPPPPPPPPPPVATPAAAPAAGGTAAVFAEINRGDEVTKGLRKVDKSEMTHKNPALRAGNVVPASSGSGPSSPASKKPVRPTKPQALAGKKPAKFALEGTKWLIEHQENERSLIVEGTEINHSVNLYGCKNSTIVVKGKVNAVTVANCQNTSILVESVVSSISVTRAPSFTLQVTGTAPMIQLDTTDSGQIYLSRESLGVEITTAKCSSINVSLPVEGEEEGIFEEQAMPEMMKTVIKDGKLVTSIVEHTG